MDEIASIWCETLSLTSAAEADGFFEHGGDSIAAMFLVGRLRDKGYSISLAKLYTHPTLGELRRACLSGYVPQDRPGTDATNHEPSIVHELLPAQHRWAASAPPNPDYYNRGWVFEFKTDRTQERANSAISALIAKHEALRTRYILDEFPPRASILAPQDAHIPNVQSRDVDSEREYRELLEALHTSLDLSSGKLLAAAIVARKGQPDLLVIIFHHLTVDGYSSVVLADELDRMLSGSEISTTIPWQPRHYEMLVRQYASSERAAIDSDAWLSLGLESLRPLPVDGAGSRSLGTYSEIDISLPLPASAGLLARCREIGLPLDRFLASVSCVQIGLLFDHQCVGMDIHTHGRTAFSDPWDFSRTIGFLRATHPFVFPSAPASFWETAKARSARIPVATFSFDALRFGGTDDHLKAGLARLPRCEVLLNFNGALNTVSSFDGQMIRQSAMSLGARRSPVQTEPYKIKLHGAVVSGQIILSIEYSSGDYRENTARRIIENIGAGLLRLSQF